MALGGISIVPCVAAILFVVLLCDVKFHVKASEIFPANVGENITLHCNTSRYLGHIYWFKGEREEGDYIAVVNPGSPSGELYHNYSNNRFLQLYEESSPNQRSFTLLVYDVNEADSANYTCLLGNSEKTFDIRVLECTSCLANPLSGSDPDIENKIVRCSLTNFHGTQIGRLLNITLNMNRKKTAIIEKNIIRFTILSARLYNGIKFEFNPYPDSGNLGSKVICIVPPQPSTQPTHSPTSTLSIITTTQPTHSPTSTLSIITTTQYDHASTSAKSPSSLTAYKFTSRATISKTSKRSQTNTGFTTLISPISFITYISTASEENTNSDTSNDMKNSTIVLIIAITGSIAIMFLIASIVVLRFKQVRGRKQSKPHQNEKNCSVDDKAAPGQHDTCYESIEEASPSRHGELLDNVLYESSDAIIESSTSRSCDQLDIALYTVPDKTGIINRVAKSKVIHDSSNSVNLHSNNEITRHHEATEYELEGQYEDVAMSGIRAGGDDSADITIYAMPDKRPRSTRNTIQIRPGTTSPENGADIPLYAMPDKGPRSTRSTITIRPETTSPENGADIPLYAMPDKGPISTKNVIKARPGPLSSTSTNDDIGVVEALYAEVDEPY